MKPGTAVCIGPAPPELLEEDAEVDAADEAAELALAAFEVRELRTLESELERAEADDAAPEATEDRDEAAAPPEPKMVVLPVVVVKVEEPLVMTVSKAEVVIAELEPSVADPPAEDEPEPLAPAKIVVEPMVVVAPFESVVTMAEVVIAEAEADPVPEAPLPPAVSVTVAPLPEAPEAPLPPAVSVTVAVADGEVTKVVMVVAAELPAARAAEQ